MILALMGEVGELAEILQWDGDRIEDSDDRGASFNDEVNDEVNDDDVGSNESPSKGEGAELPLDMLSQELADVTIYVLRLATVCNVIEELSLAMDE